MCKAICSLLLSRPAWGAWIEITDTLKESKNNFESRPAWGAWIEMNLKSFPMILTPRRAPHGARGLKYRGKHRIETSSQSRPAWGAWIDMCGSKRTGRTAASRAPHGARGLKSSVSVNASCRVKSRPAWGAWIEMSTCSGSFCSVESRPAWGAWIEMVMRFCFPLVLKVAPRMGRVD